MSQVLFIEEIIKWLSTGHKSQFIEEQFCRSRSEFNGRLFSYENTLKVRFSEDCLYLITSSFGEIGNNCFDHNLGHWSDEPGCLFIRNESYCLIVDRGQGIKSSLSKVYHLQPQDESYVSVAFSKVITGRAPEKRGNGLKFSKRSLSKCNLNLFCLSNSEQIYFGANEKENQNPFLNSQLSFQGTLTYIFW